MLSSPKKWLCVAGLAAAVAALCATGTARAVEPDKLTPSDAEAVLFINVRQMIDSPLFKKHGLEEAKKALTTDDNVKRAVDATGLDPLKDVDSILFTAGGGKDAKLLVAVRGNFNLTKMKEAAEKHAKDKPDELTITKEGSLTVYKTVGENKDKPMYAAFADAGTLLVSSEKDYLIDAVNKKNVGSPSKELKAALDKLSGKDAMWMAAVVSDDTKKLLTADPKSPLKDVAGKLESATLTFNMTTDAQAALTIYTTDAKAASSIQTQLKQLKSFATLMAQSNDDFGPVLTEVLTNTKITTDMGSVKVNLKITEEMIDKAGKKDSKDKDSSKDK